MHIRACLLRISLIISMSNLLQVGLQGGMSSSNRRGGGSRRSSSKSSTSQNSLDNSVQRMFSMDTRNNQLIATYGQERTAVITDMSQLRHNRTTYRVITRNDKRAWSLAVKEVTQKLSILDMLVHGGGDCINKIIRHSRPRSLIGGRNGGLFRFTKPIGLSENKETMLTPQAEPGSRSTSMDV